MADYIKREDETGYIKKEDAIRKAAMEFTECVMGDEYTEADFARVGEVVARVIYALQTMPPADVAPVVRCKDCKWFDKQRWVCHNPRYGDGYANYQPPNTNDEYWCADGERKDNE